MSKRKKRADGIIQRQWAHVKNITNMKVWKDVIASKDVDPKWRDLFFKYKLEVWKQLSSNSIMYVAEEMSNLKAYIMMLLEQGRITDDQFIAYSKVLLEFLKEYNKYTQISPEVKLQIAAKMTCFDEEIEVVPEIPNRQQVQ
ncbi:MAG: hypothetical protein QXN68_00470 [Thermoplasmata archaeon]